MKVIKYGSLDNPPEWWDGVLLTCRTGGTEFSLDKEDEEEVDTLVERTPNGKRTVTIACPQCGNKVSGTYRMNYGRLVTA